VPASKNTVREQNVASKYNSLTTYATYDTRNRLPLDVACGPRAHTLHNREYDVRSPLPRPTLVFRREKNAANVASKNTYVQKDARRVVTVALGLC